MLFDGAVRFSGSVGGHRPQPFNPFLSVTLPQRWGVSISPAAPGDFPPHSPGLAPGTKTPGEVRAVLRAPGAGQEERTEAEAGRDAERRKGEWWAGGRSPPCHSPPRLSPSQPSARVTTAGGARGTAGAPRSGRGSRRGAGRAWARRPQPGTPRRAAPPPPHAGRPDPAPAARCAHSPHLRWGTGRLVGARGTRRAFRARSHPRAGRTASWRPRPQGPRGWAGRRGRATVGAGGAAAEGFLPRSPRAGTAGLRAGSALAHFLIVFVLSLKGTEASGRQPPPDRKAKGCSEFLSGGDGTRVEPQRGRDPSLGGGGSGVPFGHLSSPGAGKSRTGPTVNLAGWAS